MITIMDNEMDKYYNLEKEEQFIYYTVCHTFLAIKYNNEYAILLNGFNRFIIAKVYKNCLSIGAGIIVEYNSYQEATRYIRHNLQYIEKKAK